MEVNSGGYLPSREANPLRASQSVCAKCSIHLCGIYLYSIFAYAIFVILLRLIITFSFTQKLHTLFNLSDVLSHRHPGCSNTLRDDKLPDEVRISYVFVVLLQLNHFGCLHK